MKLHDIAHSRTGDKGNIANISLIVYDRAHYPLIVRHVTAEKVKSFFGEIVKGEVLRYELPQLGALNFILKEALGGGVTRTLSLDIHGKTLSGALLSMEIPDN
jgi:hypothetical protein